MAVGWTVNASANLSLTVSPVAAPPATLDSLTVSTPAVDVTEAAATVDAAFHLVSIMPLENGSITHPWMNQMFKSRVFDSARRISGTATDGNYQVTLNLPRYLPPGPYRISRISTSFAGGTGLDFGELSEAPFPAGASRTINVTNSGPVDNDSPALARVELSPASVDVLNGPKVVTVVMQIVDPLAGFDSSVLQLIKDGKSLTYLVGSANRTAGTAQGGTYTVPITIHQDDDPGDYHLIISQIRDTLGNTGFTVFNSTDPLFPGPFTGTVHVTNTGGTANPIDTWAVAQGLTGPDAAATADTDRDGIILEMEFATGTDPKDGRIQYFRPDAAGLPVGDLTGSGASRRLMLEFWIPDDPAALKLTYTAQFSSNGTTWTDVPQAAFLINAGSSLASSTGIRRRCTVVDPTAYSEGVTRIGNMGSIFLSVQPSIVSFDWKFNQTATGTLNLKIAGPNPATPQFDQWNCMGGVTLGGTVHVTKLNGYAPAADTVFTFLNVTGGAITGTFGAVTGGFTTDYTSTSATLRAARPLTFDEWVAQPGHGNGKSSFLDYAFNTDSDSNTSAPRSVGLVSIGGSQRLTLSYRRWTDREAAGVIYTPQLLAPPAAWSGLSFIDEIDPDALSVPGSSARRCRILIPADPRTKPAQFLRVKAAKL